MFRRIAIFGLGLLGGSICRALRVVDPTIEIIAVGRDVDRIEKAKIDGNVDEIMSIDDVRLNDVELAIVSTPVIVSIDIIDKILNAAEFKDDSIVIDVGSVKGPIISEVEKNRRADRFVGCHPMAGSENIGYEHGRADLFNGASVIITPNRFNREEDITAVSNFWRILNARPIIVPAEFHDQVVSFTSHLPHVLASVFVNALRDYVDIEKNNMKANLSSPPEEGDTESRYLGIEYFIGSGFKDFTRLSSGSPDIWTDICLLNGENIDNSLTKVIEGLQVFKELIRENGDVGDGIRLFLERARSFKEGLSV